MGVKIGYPGGAPNDVPLAIMHLISDESSVMYTFIEKVFPLESFIVDQGEWGSGLNLCPLQQT